MTHQVCWKCGYPLLAEEIFKMPFRAVCEKCDTDLHVCVNCLYYQIGKPNDCQVPGTDFIADRRKANFCEDFKLKGSLNSSSGSSIEEVSRRLFKED